MNGPMTELVPFPVLLPLLAAGVSLILSHHPRMQRVFSLSVLSLQVVLTATLVWQVDQHGPLTVWVGGWPETIGIALVADRLAALMLLVSAIVTLAVLGFSIGQGMVDDEESAPISVYHPTYLVLVAGVSNAFLAGDMFNLFVSFEMLLFASYVLLTLGGTPPRLRAGTIYVLVALLSSVLFLISLAVMYGATGTLTMAHLAERIGALPDSVALMIQLLLLTTFAIKAAIFPMSFWLPDSYPTAPAPVTAVFAGLLTKVGIYAILRIQTVIFPDSPLTTLLLIAALVTLIIGILGAVAQSDIKRMLSFTLISHIGYLVLGIGLANKAGISGTIFYVVHHIVVQTSLFLVVGLIERRAGSASLLRIGGLAAISPMLAILFFVPAMNLAGIPPLSGFIGKVGLLQAAQIEGSWLAWLLIFAGVLTSLLTLYAIAKTWSVVFWRTPSEAHETLLEMDNLGAAAVHRGHVHTPAAGVLPVEAIAEARRLADADLPDRDFHQLIEAGDDVRTMPAGMLIPAAGLAIVTVVLSLVAGPLYSYADRAAENLQDGTTYVNAVLGREGR